jgi:hypothetical protein
VCGTIPSVRISLLLGLAVTLTAFPLSAQAPTPSKPDVGEGLKRERERLSNYQWRLRTEMKIDGVPRVSRIENVYLGPSGELVKKVVKFDKAMVPTPFPENDPRARLAAPTTDIEEETLFEQAQALMQFYARLSPERVEAWAEKAELMPPDPDRAGKVRLHGRGLGRPQDDAVLYLDPLTKIASEIEVKTTVDFRIVDIAFLRATFEPLPQVRPGAPAVWVPKKIFLNMTRGKRAVTLEMETSDWRTWTGT